MTNISRNSPCPCGSGKRHKHCCGANPGVNPSVLNQAPAQVKDLLNQALKLQEEGREEPAAALYEAVLGIEPKNINAHNMLAVIRAEQWRMLEALSHAHQAGELTGWRDEFFSRNYTALIRKVLRNVENERFRQTCRQYREALSTPPAQTKLAITISVLIFEHASLAELEQCLKSLTEQSLQPHEVLIAAGIGDSVTQQKWPFLVHVVDVPSSIESERINHLAEMAHGDCILALRKGDTLLPEHFSHLAGALKMSGGWSFASELPLEAQAVTAQDDGPTTGFMLLSKDKRVSTESNLLVSRELHKRIGGYHSTNPAPLLDYCLRLLWVGEPSAVTNETCLPGLGVEESADDRLAVIGRYLDREASEIISPNPFAPSRRTWGFHLFRHIAKQALFINVPFMISINTEIGNYLSHRATRPINIKRGVNLIGYVSGEFGLGENMRAFARACLDASIPCAIRDVNLGLITRQNDASLDNHSSDQAIHKCSVFYVNPDRPELYRHSLDAAVFERPQLDFQHTKIGYWFWELEKIPPQWRYAVDKVDEIWVATEFVAEAMRRATDKPVIKIPTPISFEIKGKYDRNYFRLPQDSFLFLFSFDFYAFPERKNPFALIRAFRHAFPGNRKDVSLVIKSINGSKRPEAMRALLEEVGNDPRILLRNDCLSRDEVYGLQSVVDAYVSLHRAEGLGLGLAECMYLGKPVIGTAYSGNLEFMDATNSGLINYSLVPIRKGEYLYDDPGFFWADPDEDHAAYLMSKLVDDAIYRQQIAEQGRKDIREKFNYAVIAEQMKSRLLEIGAL